MGEFGLSPRNRRRRWLGGLRGVPTEGPSRMHSVPIPHLWYIRRDKPGHPPPWERGEGGPCPVNTPSLQRGFAKSGRRGFALRNALNSKLGIFWSCFFSPLPLPPRFCLAAAGAAAASPGQEHRQAGGGRRHSPALRHGPGGPPHTHLPRGLPTARGPPGTRRGDGGGHVGAMLFPRWEVLRLRFRCGSHSPALPGWF